MSLFLAKNIYRSIIFLIFYWIFSTYPQILTFPPDIKTAQADYNNTWGVLAINSDKFVYQIGEKAKIDLAVLDEVGQTICNANIEVRITNIDTNLQKKFSTEKNIPDFWDRIRITIGSWFGQDYLIDEIKKSDECREAYSVEADEELEVRLQKNIKF